MRELDPDLISHNHKPAVSQTGDIRILLVMLETHDFLDVLDLFILHDLVVFSFSYIQQLATQGKDTEVVTSNNTETSNCESLGGVPFRQDEGTPVGVFCSGIVGVSQFGHTGETITRIRTEEAHE